VDLGTGDVSVLYDAVEGRLLMGPNDLVLDQAGNFWFTVTGTFRGVDRDFGDDGSVVHQYRFPDGFADPMPTNLCFGGPDLRTAFIALSQTGRLVRCPWPDRGLPTAFSR